MPPLLSPSPHLVRCSPHLSSLRVQRTTRLREVNSEFLTYPTEMLYHMQKNAWMAKRVKFFGVEHVLKPYVELAPEHVIPIIFLKSFRCHIMGSVVNAIWSLGCKVQHSLVDWRMHRSLPAGGCGLTASHSNHGSQELGELDDYGGYPLWHMAPPAHQCMQRWPAGCHWQLTT